MAALLRKAHAELTLHTLVNMPQWFDDATHDAAHVSTRRSARPVLRDEVAKINVRACAIVGGIPLAQ